MFITKKNFNKILTLFLFSHLIIWTLIPSVSNVNLPLDTIEALAWGSNLDWGYNKHPPLSAWSIEFFYQIFNNHDWVYYFLSQIFVVFSFFVVFKFAEDFFESRIHSLLSVLILETIYFYNFTTPEFNVNVCQLPFWALTVYYCWEGIKKNDNITWLLFGAFAALGVLSKYLFLYLLIGLDVFFIYLIIRKNFNFNCLISLISFFVVLAPHIIWLIENDYTTIVYGLHRTESAESSYFANHFIFPFIFLAKQIALLIPFFVAFLLLKPKFKIKLNFKDKKLLFLIVINLIPIILMFLTSFFLGAKIRTMWMTPFYLFIGVLFIYVYQKNILLNRLNYFFSYFLIIFIFSPLAYFYVSISQNDKRTDYPGRVIADEVKKKYDKDFKGEIVWVVGDEWHAGNLSYHLESRPKWFYVGGPKNPLNDDSLKKGGNVFTIGMTNEKISKKFLKICEATNGKFYIIKNIGFCLNSSE